MFTLQDDETEGVVPVRLVPLISSASMGVPPPPSTTASVSLFDLDSDSASILGHYGDLGQSQGQVQGQGQLNFKRDIYCWVCHMEGPLLKCSLCPRAYHRGCAEKATPPCPKYFLKCDGAHPQLTKSCPECYVAGKTKFHKVKKAPKEELSRILSAIIRNLRDGYFWPNPFYKISSEKGPISFQRYRDIVANLVDIHTLENLAHVGFFSSVEELLSETKWILHNTVIVYGRGTREAELAKDLVDLCELEVMAADLCPECFLKEQSREKNPSWFNTPCLRQPHVLGWAQTPHSPYWPVKIMRWARNKSMDPGAEEKDFVTIWTFGDYRRFDVPPSRCFLYSKEPPKHDNYKGTRAPELETARKEMDLHIKELEGMFGPVNIQDKAVPLIRFGRMGKALKLMFPHFTQEESENTSKKVSQVDIGIMGNENGNNANKDANNNN